MLFQHRAAGLHLDEHALGPEQVGEFLAAGFPGLLTFEEFELRGAGRVRTRPARR